jgi:hypothetical protein
MGRLAGAVGDSGNLELGAHRLANPDEQLALVEIRKKVVEV